MGDVGGAGPCEHANVVMTIPCIICNESGEYLCMGVEEQASLAVLVGEVVSSALLSVSELLYLGM